MSLSRLSWDILNLIPGPGKVITHTRLIELLQQDHRRDELPESFARKVLNQLCSLVDVLEPQLALKKVDRVYYVHWTSAASNLPIVRNNARSDRVQN